MVVMGVYLAEPIADTIAGRSAMEIWMDEKDTLLKAIRLLGFLPEEKIDVDQYQQIFREQYSKKMSIYLSSLDSAVDCSNLNRMIRIYDYLRYGQKRPRDSSICKQTPSRRLRRRGYR